MIPKVVILGRPNVGKSTLFNRLLGKRKVLISSQSGMTRDRQYAEITWDKKRFILIDTGGFLTTTHERIHKLVNQQVKQAIKESYLLLLVVDGKDGLHTLDREISLIIRRSRKKALVVVNKLDNPQKEDVLYEFFQLGFENVLPFSALHGINTNKILDQICVLLPPSEIIQSKTQEYLKVALVGKPNVGKSSCLNALFGREQVIVDELPGTTQDSVDILIATPPILGKREDILFIDTGGIKRKRGRKEIGEIEALTNRRAYKSIKRANIVIFLLEPPCQIVRSEKNIAMHIFENYKGCILVVNKMDLTLWKKKAEVLFTKRIKEKIPFLDFAPILFISAKRGINVERIFTEIKNVSHSYKMRIDKDSLNKIILNAYRKNFPPPYQGKYVEIISAEQQDISPPVISIKIKRGAKIPDFYQRYLVNEIRNFFGYWGSPIKLVFEKR